MAQATAKNSISKWVLGHKVTPYQTSGDYDMVMGETPPRVPGPPPHLHRGYEESFLVLEGEMEFMINGETKVARAGDLIDLPPNTVHSFNNNTDQSCKWVNIHSPKGFLNFFETLGIPDEEMDAAQRSTAPEVIQKVVTTAGDFDMIIQG